MAMSLKMAVLWVLCHCNLVELTDISEELLIIHNRLIISVVSMYNLFRKLQPTNLLNTVIIKTIKITYLNV
jgi:hypothetical protein